MIECLAGPEVPGPNPGWCKPADDEKCKNPGYTIHIKSIRKNLENRGIELRTLCSSDKCSTTELCRNVDFHLQHSQLLIYGKMYSKQCTFCHVVIMVADYEEGPRKKVYFHKDEITGCFFGSHNAKIAFVNTALFVTMTRSGPSPRNYFL